MSRLIAFGCSLTYGHSLPDCVIDEIYPGPTHSNMAWPSLVSTKMSRECVNMSSPGSSNDKILNTILNFENFIEDDHVIILWSYVHRATIFRRQGENVEVMPYRTIFSKAEGPKDWELYYKVHDDYDLYVRAIKNMHHANCYLNHRKIVVSNFCVDQSFVINNSKTDKNTKNIQVDAFYIDQKIITIDKAIDKLHPGVRTHSNMAELIYKIHKEKHEH